MIEGKGVRLRSLELSDLPQLIKYWNNMELRNLLASSALGPYSSGEEEEWIRNTWRMKREKKAF